MKMAKASEKDIDAAGALMSLLTELDRGYYPFREDGAPMFFDEEDPQHLRKFYDAVKETLDRAPGYPGRVIGGMCFVILYDKNEIVDPAADVIELHPRLVAALQFQEAAGAAARDVLAERQRQVDREGYSRENDDVHILGELGAYATFYAMPPAARDWPAEGTGYGATWGEAIVPWNWAAPKPGDRRGELVKAGALILAEIERLDRAEGKQS
jgi:hypothetical protein